MAVSGNRYPEYCSIEQAVNWFVTQHPIVENELFEQVAENEGSAHTLDPGLVLRAEKSLFNSVKYGELHLWGREMIPTEIEHDDGSIENSFDIGDEMEWIDPKEVDIEGYFFLKKYLPLWPRDTSGDTPPYEYVSVKTLDLVQLFGDEPPENYVAPGKAMGRPTDYKWDKFFLEIAVLADQIDGLPEKQSVLIRQMEIWCQKEWGVDNVPGETMMKEKVGLIYNHPLKRKEVDN